MRVRHQQKSRVCQYKLRVDRESPIAGELLVRVADRPRVLGQPVRLRLIEALTGRRSRPRPGRSWCWLAGLVARMLETGRDE
jgi:hypothetical protein